MYIIGLLHCDQFWVEIISWHDSAVWGGKIKAFKHDCDPVYTCCPEGLFSTLTVTNLWNLKKKISCRTVYDVCPFCLVQLQKDTVHLHVFFENFILMLLLPVCFFCIGVAISAHSTEFDFIHCITSWHPALLHWREIKLDEHQGLYLGRLVFVTGLLVCGSSFWVWTLLLKWSLQSENPHLLAWK